MKKMLFVFSLAICFNNQSNAQSSTVSKANTDAVNSYNGILGRFDYSISASEHLNVNYSLTPKNPTSVAHLMLNTPNPMPFSAKVLDDKGKVLLNWTPESQSYLYNAELNIASLSSGVYTVHIFMGKEPNSIYHFSFNKL
ncbi:MAG: hypothetical protein V4561_13870 [Bacteroidota bacterium]